MSNQKIGAFIVIALLWTVAFVPTYMALIICLIMSVYLGRLK